MGDRFPVAQMPLYTKLQVLHTYIPKKKTNKSHPSNAKKHSHNWPYAEQNGINETRKLAYAFYNWLPVFIVPPPSPFHPFKFVQCCRWHGESFIRDLCIFHSLLLMEGWIGTFLHHFQHHRTIRHRPPRWWPRNVYNITYPQWLRWNVKWRLNDFPSKLRTGSFVKIFSRLRASGDRSSSGGNVLDEWRPRRRVNASARR